jgi:hypothetical protein
MLRPKTKRAFLAAGVLCAAGFIVWPGCATPPLPASRTPVSSLKRADFSFGKGAHPGRDEIVAKVGHPDEYFADLKVACYKLNKIKRRRLVLLFGILPIGAPQDPDGIEVAMIRFDDRDRAERIAITIVSGYYGQRDTLHYSAQRWIAEPARVPQRH